MRAFLVSFNNPDICFLKQAKAEHAKLQRLDLYGYGFFVASGKAFLATTQFPINIDGMCFYSRLNGKAANAVWYPSSRQGTLRLGEGSGEGSKALSERERLRSSSPIQGRQEVASSPFS